MNADTFNIVRNVILLIIAVAAALFGMQQYVAAEISEHSHDQNPTWTESQITGIVKAQIEQHQRNASHSDTTSSSPNLSSIPSGAVVAFADAPTGHTKRNCSQLSGGWEDFLAADGRFILGAHRDIKTGEQGGEPDVALSEENIPVHNHGFESVFDLSGLKPIGQKNTKTPYPVPTDHENGAADRERFDFGKEGPVAINIIPPYIALTYCKKV